VRTAQFFTDGFYHVYNRGVDRRTVFYRYGHYLRFLTSIRSILRTGSATPRPLHNQSLALKSGVEILSYCLMRNHYHFILKQTQEEGISDFMHKLDTSYTKYFNLNNRRTGRLFEATFKAKHIDSDEQLLHVSRYIHINPVIAHLVERPEDWKWSSYREYFDIEASGFCHTKHILSFFPNTVEYKAFVNDQIAYAMLVKESEDAKDENVLFL
jgi:putative transposase